MGQAEKTKPDVGVEQLDKAAEQLRALARQLVEQRLGEGKPPGEVQGVGAQKEAKTVGKKNPEPWWKDIGTLAAKDLRTLVDEVKTNIVESRAYLLGSIEVLLAGADMLSWDCIESLREERDVLQGGTQSQQLEAEQESWREISFEDCVAEVKQVEAVIGTWLPRKQRAILCYALGRLPEKEAAWAVEEGRDNARDDLLNYLHNERSEQEQTAIYRTILAGVKKGNGVVELKASA
jgi:hypothetical protein